MPHAPEAAVIAAVIVMVFTAHNLRRIGDAIGRLLERMAGKS